MVPLTCSDSAAGRVMIERCAFGSSFVTASCLARFFTFIRLSKIRLLILATLPESPVINLIDPFFDDLLLRFAILLDLTRILEIDTIDVGRQRPYSRLCGLATSLLNR